MAESLGLVLFSGIPARRAGLESWRGTFFGHPSQASWPGVLGWYFFRASRAGVLSESVVLVLFSGAPAARIGWEPRLSISVGSSGGVSRSRIPVSVKVERPYRVLLSEASVEPFCGSSGEACWRAVKAFWLRAQAEPLGREPPWRIQGGSLGGIWRWVDPESVFARCPGQACQSRVPPKYCCRGLGRAH